MAYDLIIIGGGPGAVAAGVYAARKSIKSLLILKDWGGQSKVSIDIQNWIGTVSISGADFAKNLESHIKAYAGDMIDFDEESLAVKVTQILSASEAGGPVFEVMTNKDRKYKARSIIVASGSRRRKLTALGAEKFEAKGIVYCATCDAPLFKDKEVAVIGGGNAGMETAQQLTAYASKVYILEYEDEFKADSVTIDKVLGNQKVTPILGTEIVEIKGDVFVSSLIYKKRSTKEEKELLVQGIFVEIGSVPNNDFVKGLVKINEYGEVIIDHKTGRTSVEGIWAAGDITDQPYKQNNISVGDAVKALEDLYCWLQKKENIRE